MKNELYNTVIILVQGEARMQQLAELGARKQVRLHSLIIGSARRHLVNQYDILGVSHHVRFAATRETQDPEKNELLLDVFRKK